MASTRYPLVFAISIFLASTHPNAFGEPQTKVEEADGIVQEGPAGERIAEYVEALRKEGFSGAVLAARDGKVAAALGAGFADENEEDAITPATLFEIASVTKPFTAVAVVRLAAQGRLELSDSIAKHLPGVPKDCEAITVEHLARHTSGIPGTNSQGAGTDLEAVLPKFLAGGPRRPPGEHWEYWNQGYALLSEVIERASRKEYTEYLRSAIIAPAGMRSSCFTGDRPPRGAIVAVGRSTRGEPRSALEHPYGAYGLQYKGMGGLVTNVWDLWRFDRALTGERILDDEWKAKLFEPGLGSYALGWFVRRNAAGQLVQSHSGSVRGFTADLRRYPEQDGLIVVLSNRDGQPVQRIADHIENLLFPEGRPAPTPLEPGLAEALVGEYRDARGNRLVVEHTAEGLTARIHWEAGPVTHARIVGDDEGKPVLDDGKERNTLRVERRGDGPVQRITLLEMKYERVEVGD